MSTIIYPECGCLHTYDYKDETCLKRRFEFYDIKNDTIKSVLICNDYLRLKVRENRDDSYWSIGYHEVLKSVYSELFEISEDVGIKGIWSRDFLDRPLNFQIIKRPSVIFSLDLKTAFEMSLERGNRAIRSKVLYSFQQYLENNDFKKYKTKYKECEVILKKLNGKYYQYNDHDAMDLMINLLQNLILLMSKNQQLCNQ